MVINIEKKIDAGQITSINVRWFQDEKKKVIGNLPFFDDIDPEDNLQMERNTLIAFSEKGDVVEVIFFLSPKMKLLI